MSDTRVPVELTHIVVRFTMEGFHRWKEAPAQYAHLSHRHRHLFWFRVVKAVSHEDRDIEIIAYAQQLKQKLRERFGEPCEFHGMSCESIAHWLARDEALTEIEVTEDGEHGALLRLP